MLDGPANKFSRLVVNLIVALLSILFIIPLIWMVVLSTNSREDVYKFPPPITFGTALSDNFHRLIDGIPFFQSLWNSFYVSGFQTLLVLFISSFAAFGFSKYSQAPGRKILFGIMVGSIMIPGIAGLIPWFMIIKSLGWINTFWPLIIPPAASAFGVFWMYQFINGAIPNDIYEAAKIDGASDMRTYWTIVVPLIRPGLAALGILTFLNAWQNYQTPLLVLSDQSKLTLPIALSNLRSLYATDVPAVMLGTTLSILPILVAFIFMSKHFIAGLTNGSVK